MTDDLSGAADMAEPRDSNHDGFAGADYGISDAEAVDASRQNPEAFRVVFERHYVTIFHFAARRVGQEAARDVAADTFVRALANRHRYDTARASALPWLYGIATNVVGDHLRKKRRAARRRLPYRRDPDPTQESDDRLVANGVNDDLQRALSQLPQADRRTFLLYALDGLSYSEIAETLDIPVGTVGSRVFRARRMIRNLIPNLERRVDRISDTQADEQ